MEYKEYSEDIDLQKYWLILKRHWLQSAVVWGTTVALATCLGFSQKPTYEATGKLRFKKQNTTSALVTEAGDKIGQLDALNSKDTPLDTEAEVIQSAPIVNQTISELNLKDKKGESVTYDSFLKSLKVKTVRGTDVLGISYKSSDRKEAIAVVNRLIQIYLKTNILSNRAEAAAAGKFINGQLPKVEETVRQADAEVRIFKQRNNIANLEEETKATVAALDNLDRQIASTQTEIEKLTGRTTELQKKMRMTAEEALANNSLNQSVAVQQAFENLKQVEDKLAIERTRFLEDNPIIINLKSKQAALKAILEQRTKQVLGDQKQVSYESLQKSDEKMGGKLQESLTESLVSSEAESKALINQLASLIRNREAYRQRLKDLPQLEQTQRELQRKLEAAQANYQLLLKNRGQVQLAENQNVGNAQIVSPAVSPKSAGSSSKKMLIVAGIVVGSLLYVVTAFILELSDRSIKTTKEIRKIFRYTLLGMIPLPRKKVSLTGMKPEGNSPEQEVRNLPHSIISEAYRMLQANLRFLSPDRELKVIVVTSSVPKEGKSTVSTNLAVAIAQLGSRVLLIDADLHHPQQHHIWELTNEVGLSEVIVGQTELKKAVKQVMPHLDILPSGVIPPNSLALLGSQRMNSLIEDFSSMYDFVIVDTSPLLLVADALSLSKMTDGILLVSRPGVIDKVSAKATQELLAQSGQKVLGLVVNGVMVENEPDSYFHHARAYSGDDTKQPLSSIFKS
ncbi:polysaccharide biosynthesis tyrosine autokinase [Allocoleopsis sp.]|uniref:GumC family protein n=1 Tax=Allocoleopsis sp. TaxID=3088169 RepID=UPI002FD0C17F